MGRPLPDPVLVRDLLRDLFGKAVTVQVDKKPPTAPPAVVAVFADAEGAQAYATCDMLFASSAGAALAMVPAGVAADSVKAKKLEDMLLDNLTEVFNVASRWFNDPNAHPVRLTGVHTSTGGIPSDVGPAVAKPVARLDMTVAITGYSGGALSLMSG